MSTRVKICGMTRLEDARLAVELGAAALGFNFYPPSPRYVAPAVARDMIRRLPPFVTAVGVFANEQDDEHVAGVLEQAGVRTIQLHGPKFPRFDGILQDFVVVRAVAVGPGFEPECLREVKAGAFLLDSYNPALPGGTGKTFDWSLAREAQRYGTIILAGGLTPENVAEAIRIARPFAVDVASGVESSPGVKDPAKLRAFFHAVAEADKELSD
jgi:phosphoribosylanthranilate isomerase